MRIINAFAPTVPMWEIYYFPAEDKTWITPIICIAVVETRYTRAHPGEEHTLETELRPLGFREGEPNGLAAWHEKPDALGYALSPLADAEIREKWAGEIANLQRQHETEPTK
jgi:hypothetical protein